MQTAHNLFVVMVCTLVLMMPAFFNRAPFVYFDSGAYLSKAGNAVQMIQERLDLEFSSSVDTAEDTSRPPSASTSAPDDDVVAGRSIYYSFFAWGGAVTMGLGSIVFLQALTLAFLVAATVQAVLPQAPSKSQFLMAVMLTGGLALLTSAGFFVSFVMPDIWAGMMVLAFALLIANDRDLSKGSRYVLGAILALSALFHTSHLLLLAALIGIVVGAMIWPGWRRIVTPRRLLLPTVALVCGMAGHAAFSLAVTTVTGKPPITLPFVTAHLVDMGPGTRLARETCPDSGFAICPYVDRLPTDWISFLFSRDPETGVFNTVSPLVQRALSQEQAKFALASLAAEPVATTAGLMHDGVAQLWHLSVGDVPLTAKNEAFLAENFTPKVAETIRLSSIWNRPWIAPAWSVLIQIGTAFAAAGLLFFAFFNLLPRQGPLATLLVVCLVGLLLNALICGIFASPFGRFQARIVWLLPFLLVLTTLTIRFPIYALKVRRL